MQPKRLVTAEAAAVQLGICAETLRRMARSGAVPCHRFGRLVRFDVAEVAEATKEAVRTPLYVMETEPIAPVKRDYLAEIDAIADAALAATGSASSTEKKDRSAV